MSARQLARIAGVSYLIIFVAAVYANFYVLEALKSDPVATITTSATQVRFGIMAFLLAAVLDIVVAWALKELFKEHVLSTLSTYFRLIHAVIMGLAVFALVFTLRLSAPESILGHIEIFNTLWLIGLFFFGFHLILLSYIIKNTLPVIPFLLTLAGTMYIADTSAHVLMADYERYADTFLLLVAVPAVLGELSLTLWLLYKGIGKPAVEKTVL